MEGRQDGLQSKEGLGKDISLLPLVFNIYLMEMVEELARAQLEVKLEGCWCRVFMCAVMFWGRQGQSCKLCWMW